MEVLPEESHVRYRGTTFCSGRGFNEGWFDFVANIANLTLFSIGKFAHFHDDLTHPAFKAGGGDHCVKVSADVSPFARLDSSKVNNDVHLIGSFGKCLLNFLDFNGSVRVTVRISNHSSDLYLGSLKGLVRLADKERRNAYRHKIVSNSFLANTIDIAAFAVRLKVSMVNKFVQWERLDTQCVPSEKRP